MAGEAAPTDYYPNQGSFAERYMRTRETARYPNEGSRSYNLGLPPVPAASHSSWWADDLALSNGAAVSVWAPRTDDLGYGNLEQATGAAQPTFTAANAEFNGRSTVDGDGVNDNMVSASSGAATQTITIVMVMRNSNSENATNSVGHATTTEPRPMFRSNQKDGMYAGTVLQESTVQAARLGVNLYYATFNGASSSLERNGTVIVSGDAGTNDISSAFSLMTVTTQYTPSENAFIMVVDGVLTAPEKAALETWVSDYYSIVIA